MTVRQELNLDADHPALVIFNRFCAQCTSAILTLLEDKKVYVVIVPANCTDWLHPLDVSVNKAVKDHLQNQFQDWYSDQVCKQLQCQPNNYTTMLTKPINLHECCEAWLFISILSQDQISLKMDFMNLESQFSPYNHISLYTHTYIYSNYINNW